MGSPICLTMAVRIPILIFGILPALLAAVPQFHEALLFDRDAIASGQLWRLWTGHWIHFSNSHLLWNVAALVIVGTWLEAVRPGRLLRYTALAAPLISIGLLVFDPLLASYGGLSGLGTGIVAQLGFCLVKNRENDRWAGIGILGLIAIKLWHDSAQGTALLSNFGSTEIVMAPTSHLIGALLALVIFVVKWFQRSGKIGSKAVLISSTNSGSMVR